MIVRIPKSTTAWPGSSSPRRGLSLLEVLVALAIFLFSLAALSQLVEIGSNSARDVQWLGQASMIAQSRMSAVMAGIVPLSGQPESSCDEDSDWMWSMEAELADAPGLYRVKVTVSRQRPDGSRFETVLNQFVLDPTVRGSTDGSATGSDDTSGTTTGTPSATGTTGGTTPGGGGP